MKRIKIHIVKFTAIVISAMYILMPIHKEVKSVLHTISHNLKAPSYVLQHNEVDNSNFINQVSLKTEISNYNLNHQHEIIDFLDIFFDSSSNRNDDHQGESLTLDFKINKHITSNKYAFVFQNRYQSDTPNFRAKRVFYKNGYLAQLYRPPKV